MISIRNFTDDKGRIKVWATKQEAKLEILRYVATKFESGRFYSEKEVNAIIEQWHTFGDLFLIRRGLIDYKLMNRTQNGARYWIEEAIGYSEIANIIEGNYSIGYSRSIACLAGGYGSRIYYVQSDNGSYIFRDIEQDGMNHPENEAQIIAELKKYNIPTPDIIPANNGDYLVAIEDKIYQLRSFAEGKMYDRNSAPNWLLSESACLLGRIQRCMEQLPPLPDGISSAYFRYFTPERAEHNHLHTLETADAMRDLDISMAINCKIKMIRALKPIDLDFSKLTCKNTHGDYKIQHLICQNERISSVIDFTSSCTHPVCWEVMRSYTLSAPECADGVINIESFKRYISNFLEYGTLNDYDLKFMPLAFYYQNVIADYFGQYFAMENKNKHVLLNDAFLSLKICTWLEQNLAQLENALIWGF